MEKREYFEFGTFRQACNENTPRGLTVFANICIDQ